MSGYTDLLNNDSGSQLLKVTLDRGAANNNGNLRTATYQNGSAAYPPILTFQQTYGYDGVNRINSVIDTGYSRSFQYDPYGNLWVTGNSGVPLAGNTPTANVYTSANRINGASYDAAGNQTVVNGNTLAYDAENRQNSVTDGVTHAVESYLYDGDGKRVQKTGPSGATVYVYDALGQLAAEYSTTTATSPCTTCYLVWDHLGTPRLVTDQNAAIVARHDYLPFGEEIPANTAGRSGQFGPGNDNINQKFTGKERDQETGLDYFGARYYGAALGRFTSPDEFKGGIVDPFTGQDIETNTALPYADITDPQTLNKYAYVRNNPLRYTDPNGHCIEDACVVEIGVAVAVGEGISGTTIAAGLGTLGGAIANILGGGSQMTPYGIGPNTGLYASQMSANKPGTLGKPDHQQTADEEAERIDGRREVKIDTPGGQKGSRRADAAQVDENGKPNGEIVQVYRPTKGGNIPNREVDAANDIKKATGTKPTMVPVRPVKPPCTPGAGGGCQQ